jgi:hypothetical protein
VTDSGSIVLGWLTKLVISLAIFGLLVFDGLALLTTTFTAADHANTAASEAAETYRSTHNVELAFEAADTEAAKNAETIDRASFVVHTDTGRVTLTLHKTAVTLWMHHIGPLKRFTRITGKGEGSPPL